MLNAMILISAVMSTPTVPTGDPVGYRDAAAGQNAALIERVDTQAALQADDPAVLINLGIAYAREGNDQIAAILFDAAVTSDNRCELETATGDWVNSRKLAQRALDMLAQGGFTGAPQAPAITDAS